MASIWKPWAGRVGTSRVPEEVPPRYTILRFLLAGGFNTAATFVIYVGLVQFLPYAVAYTFAFATGIAISYALNRSFVFRARGSRTALALFPFVYVFQYLLGLGVVAVWADLLELPVELASLAAIMVTLPVTYALLRRLFVGHGSSREITRGP